MTLEDTLRRAQPFTPKGRSVEPGRKGSEHHLGEGSLRASLWGNLKELLPAAQGVPPAQ